MLTLTINNSISQVTGFNKAQYLDLRALLSYEQTIRTKFSGPKQVTKYLVDKHGRFPSGLLYLVEEYLNQSGVLHKRIDSRIRPRTRLFGPESLYVHRSHLPYPEQTEAARIAFKRGRGIIVAPTGAGKTQIVSEIIDLFQVPTLIVVPSVVLKHQLTETLTQAFGNIVGPWIKGSKKQFFITVDNMDSLENTGEVDKDLVIIDEFHHSGCKTIRQMNEKFWKNVYFRIGVTVSSFRSRSEERLLLESVLSEVIYKVDYKTCINKNYIAPLEVYTVELEKQKVPAHMKYPEAYDQLIINKKDRTEKIVQICQSLHADRKSTLVLVKQLKHGRIVQEALAAVGIDVPFANGEDEASRPFIEQFASGEIPLLIASGVVGEGCDTKAAEFVILAGGVGNSKVQIMQNLGRVFRRYPGKESGKAIVLYEPSSKWFVKHYDNFCQIVKEEYGVLPVKINL